MFAYLFVGHLQITLIQAIFCAFIVLLPICSLQLETSFIYQVFKIKMIKI